jgi:hypothetical protein
MVELIAGLLIAALLVGGLVDIIRRYARTTDSVRTTAETMRDSQMAGALLAEIIRIDPETLSVTPRDVRGQIGDSELVGQLVRRDDRTELRWSSPLAERTIDLPKRVRFERQPSGAIVLADGEHVIALALPRRTIPFNCQFDTVSRECRK